jgi:hypothetical protein
LIDLGQPFAIPADGKQSCSLRARKNMRKWERTHPDKIE